MIEIEEADVIKMVEEQMPLSPHKTNDEAAIHEQKPALEAST